MRLPQLNVFKRIKNSVCVALFFLLTISSAHSQALQWSTYLNTSADDLFTNMVRDNAGDIYVLGTTTGNGFPVTPGAFQPTLTSGTSKLTVSKLSGATGSLLWSTYLGGDNDDIRNGRIYWDATTNSLAVCASSKSDNFPLVNGGSAKPTNISFYPTITRFNPATGAVLYSSFVSGLLPSAVGYGPVNYRLEFAAGHVYFISTDTSSTKILIAKMSLATNQYIYQKLIQLTTGTFDYNLAIYTLGIAEVDGDLYFTGVTTAKDYPTTPGAYQPNFPAGATRAYFISKLDAAGNFIFSTFANEAANQDFFYMPPLAVGNGEIAIGGQFYDGIPVSANGIAFNNVIPNNMGIIKLDANSGQFKYFTYMGANPDFFYGIRDMKYVGSELVFFGNSEQPWIPVTPNALQLYVNTHVYDGIYAGDMFIGHLDGTGKLVYCSYLGGDNTDNGFMTVIGSDVYFTVGTNSTNWPTTPNATQPVYKGNYVGNGRGDMAFVKYSTSQKAVTYSSYLGTNVNEYNASYYRPVLDAAGNLYVSVYANQDSLHPITTDFPTTPDAFQKTMVGSKGTYHQYIAKINTNSGKVMYGSYIGSLPDGKGELPNTLLADGDDVFVGGYAYGNDYPVTAGGPSTAYKGGTEMFVTKLSLCKGIIIYDTLMPKDQLVCAKALVDTIIGSVPQLGNVVPVLRNGIVQPQENLTNFVYQWQSSTDGANWTFINGATDKDYQPGPVSVKTYFRRLAKSAYCDITDTSTISSVTLNGLVSTIPDVGSDGTFFACPGNNIILGTTAIPGVMYKWEPASHLANSNTAQVVFNNASAGAYTYVLYATNSNGCTAMDTATVYNYKANAGSDRVLCQGKPALIGGSALAGLPGVSYAWSPTVGLSCGTCAQPTASMVGTYILTVSVPLPQGGNCTTKDTVVVTASTIGANPGGPDITVCNATSATLGSAKVDGYTYSWTPGVFLSGSPSNSQPIFNEFLATLYPLYNPINYVLTASNPVGCTIVDTVKVNLVNPDAGFAACRPSQLGRADYTKGLATYKWVEVIDGNETEVLPDELSNTNIANPIALAAPQVTTSKTYRLKMSWNGVTCSDDVLVSPPCTGAACPTLRFKSKSGCPTVEGEDSVTLYVDFPNPGYTYTWSPAIGLSTTTGAVVKTGIKVSTTYTCTATNKYDGSLFCKVEIKVNLFNTTAPVFSARDTTICKGREANIGQPEVVGLNYTWTSSKSNGAVLYNVSNPTIVADEDISYYVEVTDPVTNCHGYDTVKIHVPYIPVDAGVASRPSCSSGGFTIGTEAVPGISYRWVPSTGLDNANIAQPTVVSNAADITYVLVATEPVSGCTAVDATFIQHTDNPTLEPIAVPTPYCVGSNGSVKIGNPALSGVAYSWSPTAGLSNPNIAQPIASPNSTTTYTVTATFSGSCASVATQDVTVTVVAKPTVTPSVANNCESSQLDVTTNATSPYYYWSPATSLSYQYGPNPISYTNIPVAYSVNVTDQVTGCSNSALILVTPPVSANAGADVEYCIGNTAKLGAPAAAGASYSWQPSTGLSNSGISQPVTLSNLPAGMYIYYLSVTANGCTKTDSVIVRVNAPPEMNFTDGVTICKNGAVQIGGEAAAGVSYSWSPAIGLNNTSIGNPIASPAQTTRYTVVATNLATNCTAVGFVTVTVNSTGAPELSAAGSRMCTGGLAQLTANVNSSGDYSYVWSPNRYFITNPYISNPIVSPPATTEYQVLVTNKANGCSNTATATVIVKDTCNIIQPLNWLSFTASLQNGKTQLQWTVSMEQDNKEFIVERSTDGIHWSKLFSVASKGNSLAERTYSGVDEAPQKGINFYRIKQVDLNGKFSYTVIRTVQVEGAAPSFIVYPNPAHNVLNYVFTNIGNSVDLMFHSADGRLVKKLRVAGNNGSVSIQDLPAGMYIVSMSDGTGKTDNKKVIVRK